MNTEAVRRRNARKRAKLRAGKRGEVLTHVFLDAEIEGCRKQHPVPSSHLDVYQACRFCDMVGEKVYTRVFPEGIYLCSLYGVHKSWSNVYLPGDTSALEVNINELINYCSTRSTGYLIRITVTVTTSGQQRSQQWQETTGAIGIGAADVVAAVRMLGQSLSPAISSSLT